MIEHAREGNVHVVTLGDDANLINPAFVARLHEVLDAVEAASDGASGLVLTARGKFFSNGLDVAELMQLPPDAMKQFNRDLVRAFGRLVTLPVPSVAAVNGHAFAGGAVLATGLAIVIEVILVALLALAAALIVSDLVKRIGFIPVPPR